VQEMLHSLQNSCSFARKQREVALPLAKAFVAHALGHYTEAFEIMEPIIYRVKEIGGSNAQLDLFAQTYADVLLKSEHHEKAKSLLEARTQQRPCTPQVMRQLSRVYKVCYKF